MRRRSMQQLRTINRKELKNKMAIALKDNMGTLSTGMQNILLDDLITAFESRLAILNQVQSNVHCFIDIGVRVQKETLPA